MTYQITIYSENPATKNEQSLYKPTAYNRHQRKAQRYYNVAQHWNRTIATTNQGLMFQKLF